MAALPKLVVKNFWRAGEIIAVSSENPQFPAEFTQADSKKIFWRSAGVSGAINIDCDFGAISEYDFIGMLGHNLTADAQIIFHGSDYSSFTPEEKMTDGGFESWNSATDLVNWGEFKLGSSTVNRESTEKYSGTYSLRLDIDASNSGAGVQQIIALAPSSQYYLSLRYKTAAGKTAACRLYSTTEEQHLQSDGSFSELPAYIDLSASVDWNEYSLYFTTPPFYTNYILMVGSRDSASSSIYVDAVSILSAESDNLDTLTYRANDIFALLSTPRNRRYGRIQITDTSNPSGYLQIGTMVVGKAQELNRRHSQGYQEGPINETEIEYSPSMNFFTVQEKPSLENKILTLNQLNESSKSIVASLLRECGTHKAWILCLDPDSPNENTHWIHLKSISLPVNQSYQSWGWECEIEEII